MWTSPRTWVTGEVVTAALLNTHLRDNLLETATGKVTTAGDFVYATGANALARLGIGSAGQYLMVSGGAPAWASLSLAGPFEASIGSASAPSYAFSGDTNTGVYSSGANTLNFATNGTNWWKIDIGGNLIPSTTSQQDIGDATYYPSVTRSYIFSARGYIVCSTNYTNGPLSGPEQYLVINGTRTQANGTGRAIGLDLSTQFTASSGATITRATQINTDSVTATVTGTIDNHNVIYLGTPSGGTTVRIIDSASGAYLTTGGTWTNASHEFAPDGKEWKVRRPDLRDAFDPLALLKSISVHAYDLTDREFVAVRDVPVETIDGAGKAAHRFERRESRWHVAPHDRVGHLGVFAEELHAVSPLLCRDGHGVDGVTLASFAILANQELLKRVEALEGRREAND